MCGRTCEGSSCRDSGERFRRPDAYKLYLLTRTTSNTPDGVVRVRVYSNTSCNKGSLTPPNERLIRRNWLQHTTKHYKGFIPTGLSRTCYPVWFLQCECICNSVLPGAVVSFTNALSSASLSKPRAQFPRVDMRYTSLCSLRLASNMSKISLYNCVKYGWCENA